jgi:hypothetical protein
MRPFIRLLVLLWGVAALAVQAAEPSPALIERSDGLVRLVNDETPPDRFFSPAFLAQVPPSRVREIAAQLRASYGPARKAERIDAISPTTGTVAVRFERAVVRMQMAVNPKPPHLVEELLVGDVESTAADVPALFGQIVGLPGDVSLIAARLEDGGPANFLTQKAERPLAIGSAFKLFVLAELARAVKAGERRWSDVVPLGRPSLPSGLLQDWPKGSPITLHSLAALMISRSDNSAADTLLAVLGRDKVEAVLPAIGVAAPALDTPFLSTREAFVLKFGDPALLRRWRAADSAGRRALLDGELAAVDPGKLDPARFTGRPVAISEVEWFASPADLVRTLDWLRRNGDPAALELLAINPGLDPALARDFAYFGFKGGSEPGVLSMSFLLRNREGRWLGVSAVWNNEAAALDEPKFAALMRRLVGLMK